MISDEIIKKMSFVTVTNTQLVRRDLIRRVSLDEKENKVDVDLDTNCSSQTVSVKFDTLKAAQKSFESIQSQLNEEEEESDEEDEAGGDQAGGNEDDKDLPSVNL